MSLVEKIVTNSKKSGYHLGNLILDGFLHKPKEEICQIDAWTGKKGTNGVRLQRSVRLARSLRQFGLRPGDVLALGGRNHLDIYVPYYAALFNGLPVIGIDPNYKYDEIKKLFKLTEPKIAFCQPEMLDVYQRVARDIELDLKIVTFLEGECSLDNFLDEYDTNEAIEDFRCSTFDLDKVYAWLCTTSGTTGGLKVAAFKHGPILGEFLAYFQMKPPDDIPKLNLNVSPVQWISSFITAAAAMTSILLMSSGPDSTDHIIDVINEYKPVTLPSVGPSLIAAILRSEKQCDLSCLFLVYLTGSKVYRELLTELKSRIHPKGVVIEMYGQTETIGAILMPNPRSPVGSCGASWSRRSIKLVDINTGEEITEPHVPGEMWVKGPSFTEYYNDPKATAEAFTEDGWYKTGDLLYRDENNFYYYVERIKMLIKYRGNTIMPPELEEVIMTLDGVQEVAVTSVPDPVDCERPVACVVRRPGYDVTAQQVKDLVASKLSPNKQLHGGVVFLEALPKTSTGKVLRSKLKDIVLTAERL